MRIENGHDNNNNHDNAAESFKAQQHVRLTSSLTAAPPALPDYTNGHEKGYQNVRVGQGKPLTSGNMARLLLPVDIAAEACRPKLQ